MSGDPVNVRSTLGALLLGVVFSSLLFGVLTLQVYNYHVHFSDDRLRLKSFVAGVWLVELLHFICVVHVVYVMVIIGFGRSDLLVPPASFDLSMTLSGLLASTIQAFYAERVRILTGRLLFPVICWAISTLVLVACILGTIESLRISPLSPMFLHKWGWLLTCITTLLVSVDFVVAASLCLHLSQHRRSFLKRTAKIVEKLTMWTIQTGVLTSIGSISLLICYHTMPNNFTWVAIFTVIPRLYSNSLLATLNARSIIRDISSEDLPIESQLRRGTAVDGPLKALIFAKTECGSSALCSNDIST